MGPSPGRAPGDPGGALIRARFEGQGLHAVALVALLSGALAPAVFLPGFLEGSLAGLPAVAWYFLSLAVPIAHQAYVWFCWRWELHGGALTRRLGARAFRVYACGFFLLLLTRPLPVILLAFASRGTLAVPVAARWALSAAFLLPLPWLFLSVSRDLGWRRVAGLDHFDPTVRTQGLVRKGVFRWSGNALYTFGPPSLWIPGLALQSSAALAAAAFAHLYIWVHYVCTERPDLRAIYGSRAAPGSPPLREE